MRYSLLSLLLATTVGLFAQNINTTFVSTYSYPGQTLANIWGYAAGGREYALVGAYNGLSIEDVTNPGAPVHITQIPGSSSSWHEIKTYSHYAYVVSEGGSGVQIVDLNGLPGTTLTYQSYFGDGAINGLLTRAHALHIDETKGYLYVYGSQQFSGKPLVFNLNIDPYNPVYVNYVDFIGYGHDGYVDNDRLYTGHIYAGMFSVVDMTNKNNPVLLASQSTPGAFTHNTWASGNTLFTTDEISNSYLSAYDISNLNNITLLDKIQSNPGSSSIVHNTYIINDYAITSWYKDGFTITDVSRPDNMVQVGNYDTYPTGSGSGFSGCWGVYPYLPSGNILLSNINGASSSNGELWIVSPNYVRGCYVEGTITSAATGFPLNGAKVEVLTTTTTENTVATGVYKMGQLQSGLYTARVSKGGYITQNIPVTLTNGVVTILNAALQVTPLPVELVRFQARAEEKSALLTWETASEKNNAGFEVQQSENGHDWKPVGFVPSRLNSTAANSYSFSVNELWPGIHYFRLRQTDLDGSDGLSEQRSVQIKGGGFRAELLPNVVRDQCRLHLAAEESTSVQVEVYGADARPTGLHWAFSLEQEMEFPLSVEALPTGTYLVVVQTERGRTTLRMVKN